jgi:ubiquinone/menaquinone biosynthesis C-methylase UbiE
MDSNIDLSEASGGMYQDAYLTFPPSELNSTSAPSPRTEAPAAQLPAYLQEIYSWAYLNPRNVRLLDRELVVSVILWGNHHRLRRAACAELLPGQRVLQPACVYGDFSPALARHLGPEGRLDVIDVAPIQVEGCRRKLSEFPQAVVWQADAAQPRADSYDAVCCYFLLHELPYDYKGAVVDTLLESVVPGGKVVFVDYHKPHWAHPLKPITSLVFDTLEPFAKDLWHKEITDFASAAGAFVWRKQTYFAGLFQKVVCHKAQG